MDRRSIADVNALYYGTHSLTFSFFFHARPIRRLGLYLSCMHGHTIFNMDGTYVEPFNPYSTRHTILHDYYYHFRRAPAYSLPVANNLTEATFICPIHSSIQIQTKHTFIYLTILP
jgi:hypothetical protein